MKKLITWILSLMMVFALTACAAPAATTQPEAAPADATTAPADATEAPATDTTAEVKNFKVGVSIMELTAYTWYQGVIDGCNQWMAENGAKNGVNITFTFEDSHSDVATMLNNVENMVAAGSDGIILFPADASSAIPTMKQYVAQGIPFIIGDYAQETTSPDDVVWSTFVGHDMKALGVKAGEVAVEYLKTLNKDNPVCTKVAIRKRGTTHTQNYSDFWRKRRIIFHL